ncbi:ISAs1 family transposase [Simkania negevensis]|uniref:ISAs1 family transposase n=1 Tax=Simkania negevensis TaxID=83561 RepID=A0ABS3AW14_9BACT|nr:ISAs1 family transposase [Simkania negevensis]
MNDKKIESAQREAAELAFTLVDEHFAAIEDYRRSASTSHILSHIIFITLCASIAGANKLKEVAEYAKDMEDWFESILELREGVPSYGTFWLVFKHLDPDPLSSCFVNWVQAIVKRCTGGSIAIDGKAQRGTAEPGQPNSFVHIVSAWAAEAGLTLGQFKVDSKSNEITAIPKLLELIDVKGAVVTIDAMGTQKEIAKTIVNKGADYILALKGNQSFLQAEVVNFTTQAMEHGEEGVDFSMFEQKNEGHGRRECRRIYATNDIDFLEDFKKDWKSLNSIIWIESERTVNGKTTREIRHYVSTLSPNPEELGVHIRSHWGIENKVHWLLDVAFREDEQKARAGHIPENMSLIRRMALNLLSKEKSAKVGIEIKRQKAGRKTDYLLKILNVKF